MNKQEALAQIKKYRHQKYGIKLVRVISSALTGKKQDTRLLQLKAYVKSLQHNNAELDYAEFKAYVASQFPSEFDLFNLEALEAEQSALPCRAVFEALMASAPLPKKAPEISKSAPRLVVGAADLDVYPSPLLDPLPAPSTTTQITLGDLHGNALTLIYSLIRERVLSGISKSEYAELVALYKKPVEALTEIDINRFKAILNNATATPPGAALVRLIGDVLCDRGGQDLLTLLVLKRLGELKVPVEIIASNHDIEFLKAYTPPTEDKPFITFNQSALKIDQTRSMTNLQKLLEKIPSLNAEVSELVRETYLPSLKLLNYSLSESAICICTHAPVGFETIQAIAEHLGIEFKQSNATEVVKSIDAINEAVAKLGGISALLKEMSEIDSLTRIIWNRDYTGLNRPAYIGSPATGGIALYFSHGHDHSQPFPYHPHIINLDNELGKNIFEGVSPGKYNHQGTYRVLRTQTAVAALKPALNLSSSESSDPEELSRSPLEKPASPTTEDPRWTTSPARPTSVESNELLGLRIKF